VSYTWAGMPRNDAADRPLPFPEMNARLFGIRLGVAFALLVGILIGIGVLDLRRMDRINVDLEEVLGRRWRKLQLAHEARMDSSENSRITMEVFLVNDKRLIDSLLTRRAETRQKISELLEKIKAQCDSPDECQLLTAVENARASYEASYQRALHALVDEAQSEAARAIMIQETAPALYKYQAAWSTFMQFQMAEMDKAASKSRARYGQARTIVLVLIVLAVIVAMAIAFPVTLKMTEEVRTRILAEQEARQLNADLELKVQKRTQELVQSNQQLSAEIEERTSAEGRMRLQVAALQAAANSIVITDVTGKILWVNSAFTRLTGYSGEEAVGQNPRFLRSGKHDPSFYKNLWKTITSGEVWHGEVTNRRKDGSLYEEEMTITPVRAESGEITHFVAIKQDVTTRKAIAEALLHAQEKYRGLVEDAVVGIFQATPDGRIITANAAMARMHGYDSPQQLMSEVSDAATQLFVNPNQLQEISRLLEKNEVAHDVEVEVNRRDGTMAWLLGNLRAVRGRDGRIVRHEGTVQDITERKAAEKQVQYLAYYDALTGLPNRTLFRDRLTKALASARRRKEKVALLFFDLDRFKTINDSLGHSVGDLLLKEVAERLKGWAREQDTVARLGGDEFVVVLTGIKEVADIAVAANRILNMMATEFAIQGQLLRVTCSLGISVFPDHGPDAEALLKSADAAMYYAIDKGGNNFQFFTQDMNARAMERLTLENSLRLALEREELFLVYQPQVDLPTGAIVGAEALLRWRHPQMGLVPPSKFIAIAENSGLMLPFGEWVLKTACAQARQWQDQGLPPLPIAVNVSAVQFRHERFLEVVREVLEESGLAPQYLELELTESLLLSSADVTLSLLRQLHGMGLRLSIDDFGTGYSSLSYLRHFPVYKLKIDRSFMQNITVSTDNAAVTAAIINLARSLNLKVLAEGVENEEQMFFLRAHNCDEVQGYYFSHPLAASDFAEKVRCTLPLAPGLPQDGKLLIRQSADLRTPNSHSKPREALASPLEI